MKAAGGDLKAARACSVALEARRKLDKVFAVDSRFDDMDPQERKRQRDEHVRPLLEEFEAWALDQRDRALEGFELHKALSYACAHMPYVRNVLEDGRLEFSNNIALCPSLDNAQLRRAAA